MIADEDGDITRLVSVGDVLDETGDVLFCPANQTLALSGGVGAAIRERAGDTIQQELRDYLRAEERVWVECGSAIRTSAGRLKFQHIIHVVGVDSFYNSTVSLIHKGLTRALELARSLDAHRVVTTAIATGYGPLSVEDFAQALLQVLSQRTHWAPIREVHLVLRRDEDARRASAVLRSQS